MWKYLNKGISTPIAIGIILILVIIVGGFTWWQYGGMKKEESNAPEVQIPEKEENLSIDFGLAGVNQETGWNIGRSENYGFEFEYPKSFDIEVKKERTSFSYSYSYCPKIFEIVLTDPSLPKVVYDCCYTEEEVDQYGHVPEMTISIRTADCSYTDHPIGPQAEKIKEELEKKNISQELIVPTISSLSYQCYEGKDCIDSCETLNLLNINDFHIIKGTKCYIGGTRHDSIFTFLAKGGYIINISDESAAYETQRDSIFNQILSTFKFIEEDQLSPNTKANLVYLTDEKYDGNLSGRLGADEKCIPSAGLNCDSETIHAFITVNENDSIINMVNNYNFNKDLPIYWYNAETKKAIILAENWSKMLSEDIIHDQGEGTGKGKWSGDFPWTGGKGNITVEKTCNQWTTNEGDPSVGSGPYGTIGGTDETFWLSSDGWPGISLVKVCANKRYLRCICEGTINQ